MPPPSFSSASGLSALNVSRGTLALVKDVSQSVHSAIVKGGVPALDAARSSVAALLQDASLDASPADSDLLASAGAYSSKPSNTVRSAVAEKINADMIEAFESVKATPAVLDTVVVLLSLCASLFDAAIMEGWWERALYPALYSTALTPQHAEDVRILVVYTMMVSHPESGKSIAQRVLDLYVDAASSQPELAPLPEDFRAELGEAEEADDAPLEAPLEAPQRETRAEIEWRRTLEMIIALYSTQRPTAFFEVLASTLGDVQSEGPVLYLLASFLHAQSMHAYCIVSTPLLNRVLETLLHTFSTRSMSFGTKCLVMALPHIPQYVAKGGGGGVPALFAIYGRAVTWRRGTGADGLPSCVTLLFTLLYGLFPCNLLAFLRDAKGYLAEHAKVVFDVDTMRERSVTMLRGHAVHPLLAEADATTELTNSKRWAQHDASDLTASCMSLCITPKDDIASADALLDAHIPASDVLLRTEHKFELYLKEQLLLHIGRLHRDRITDAASEAEHQSLYHTVRTLRAQLLAAQGRAERQRLESQAANNRHVQWERELNTKLNTYREERRSWGLETKQLQKQLADSQAMIATQAAQITEMGSRLFQQDEDLALARPKLERLQEYGENVRKLSNCLSDWEDDLDKYELQSREMDKLLSWWEEMELTVSNSEANANRYRVLLEQRTSENTRLKSEVGALRAEAQRNAQRLAANQTWLLEAVVAPAKDRAQDTPIATPKQRTPNTLEELDKLRDRNRHLELETMNLRSRIEQLETEALMRERSAPVPGPTPVPVPEAAGATLFSPDTLRTPRDASVEDESVPPLELGSPAHGPVHLQ